MFGVLSGRPTPTLVSSTSHRPFNTPDATPDEITSAGDAAEAAADAAVPTDKAQRNSTDPDSKIIKTPERSLHQCYNAQAIVDETSKILVASEVDQPGRKLSGTTWDARAGERQPRCCARPRCSPTPGYFSEDNSAHCVGARVDALIATRRFKHKEPAPPAPCGPIRRDATVKQRMARRLSTEPGRAGYAGRKAIVEPVFGQMHTRQNVGQVRLRGLEAAARED